MTLPIPPHFQPERMAELWVERTADLAEAAPRWRRLHGIRPAVDDRPRIAVFGIDCQVSFCHPSGGLFVPGALSDAQRVLGWLYRNLGRITGWVMSLDTHEVYQIFHPAFWRDREGVHPRPFTPIASEDVVSGRWIPERNLESCIEYTRALERDGKYQLTIWPYHGLLGGVSGALLPAFTEAMFFHALTREAAPRIVVKGREPLTEMYSVFAPEVRALGGSDVGRFDESLFQHLMSFDRVYVFGQAASHCVLATLEDIRSRIEAAACGGLERFLIMEDAMSSVPAPPLEPLPPELDYPKRARERIDALVSAGMGRVRTTDRCE